MKNVEKKHFVKNYNIKNQGKKISLKKDTIKCTFACEKKLKILGTWKDTIGWPFDYENK